jgi:hypothetical protein
VGITSRMLRSDGSDAERVRRHHAPSDRPVSSSAGGVFRASKRLCTDRARWRLVRGQDAKRLSEHYQLECDYGTSILTVYNEGDPVFLCESHLSAIPPSDNCIAGVRPVGAKDETSNRMIGRAQTEAAQLTLIAAAVAGATANPSTTEVPNSAGQDALSASIAEEVLQSGDSCTNAKTGENPAEVAEAPTVLAMPSEVAPKPSIPEVSVPSHPEEAPETARADAAGPNVPIVESVSEGRGIVAARVKREAAPVSRTPARDLTYGNAAKALVDETIWNMATGDLNAYRSALAQGKSEMEAAQAAGGQIAVIHRKIAEYAAKIEPMLSASKASISAGYAIDKPLEQVILEIIESPAMSEAEKDAAVAHLGALQEQIKSGLQREIAPLQAHRLAREIGDRCNWGGDSGLPEEVKHAYRAVYARLRDALRAFVPETRELDERLANLYAAKADLESAPGAKAVRSAAL